jgi:hypothetical protein
MKIAEPALSSADFARLAESDPFVKQIVTMWLGCLRPPAATECEG